MSCSCCSLCLLASFLMRRSPLSTLFPYTTLFRSSDSLDARRANDSTVNSSRARTGPPGGPPPLLTDTGTDKEPAADPDEEPGPDEDTGTAPSWSRTDTNPTPLSTPPHGGCFPPMTRKITRHPHTKNRTRPTPNHRSEE